MGFMKKFADFFVLLAGILWGLVGPFVTNLNRLGISSLHISALRWIFSAIFMFLIVLIFDRKLVKIHIKDIWVFACTGILCIFVSSTLYFATIPLATVAVANILMYTSPVWIMIFSIIFFNEKVTFKKMVVLLLAFCGCVLVTGVLSSEGFSITPLGLVLGLASGLFYGLYSIFGKLALKKYDSITVTLYTAVFAGIAALFMPNLSQTLLVVFGNREAVLNLAAIIFICTIATYTLYTLGLKLSSATRASIFACVEPVTSAIVGTLVLMQPFSVFQLAGIVFVLAAGVILQIKK
jgi:drug/metabolite transporter (DMT)-like permease